MEQGSEGLYRLIHLSGESFSPSTAALRVDSLGMEEGCLQRESWAPEHHTPIHQNESRQGLE